MHSYDDICVDDDVCLDGNGDQWPEHDYNETECSRCGAEPDSDICREGTSCEEYGHLYDTEPEDIALHICRDCGDSYRD